MLRRSIVDAPVFAIQQCILSKRLYAAGTLTSGTPPTSRTRPDEDSTALHADGCSALKHMTTATRGTAVPHHLARTLNVHRVQKALREGRPSHPAGSMDFPMVLWEGETADPDDLLWGFCRNVLLYKVRVHAFM